MTHLRFYQTRSWSNFRLWCWLKMLVELFQVASLLAGDWMIYESTLWVRILQIILGMQRQHFLLFLKQIENCPHSSNMPISWWFIYKWARTQVTLSSDFRAQPSSRYRNFFFEKPFAFGFGAKKLFIIFLHLDIERMKEDSIMKRTRFLVPKEFFQRLFLLNVLQQKPSPSKQKGFLASAANKERELPLTVAMMTKLGNGN